jgi:hypothetical protein
MVGEPTDSQQIERAIERYTVLKAQAFFCQNLLGNWLQTRVVNVQA